jgi:hypothetical protein
MKTDRHILRKCATMLALIVSGAFLLEACAKEPSPLEEADRITMTTKATKVQITVAGAEDIAVDWGDGKKSNVKNAVLDGGYFMFSYEYLDATAHNIIITGNVTELYCSRIELIVLDVSRNTALTILHCSNNKLTSLDVSRNTVLTQLECIENRLTSLDVSRNTALKDLNCSRNQLTALNVSRNTMLRSLNCNHNQIRSLDVSKNTALTSLFIIGNQLTAPALNDLFISLPDDTKTKYVRIMLIAGRFSGNPGNSECDQSIAEKKGWGFIVDIRE